MDADMAGPATLSAIRRIKRANAIDAVQALGKQHHLLAELQHDLVAFLLVALQRCCSRELHDRVLQLLSSIRMRAESCRRQHIGNRGALESELQTIEDHIDRAITEIRNLLTWAIPVVRISRAHDAARLSALLRATAYRAIRTETRSTWALDA